MDLYRLGGVAEGFEIGLLDYLSRVEFGILIVEWAEKILPTLPVDHLRVEFEILSAKKRQIVLSSFGEKSNELLLGSGK